MNLRVTISLTGNIDQLCFKPTGCESVVPQYIGDGYCDDENNNDDCNFDGGDCCKPNVNTQYCTECICYANINCDGPLDLIDNGICNDETNTAWCNYDGGDCCGECTNTELCTTCVCHAEAQPAIDHSCK